MHTVLSAPCRHRRRSILLAVFVAAALVVSACGSASGADDRSVAALPAGGTEESSESGSGEGSPGDGPDRASTELTPEEATLAFDQCMADKGIDTAALFGDVAEGESIGGDATVQDDQEVLAFETDQDFEEFEAAQEECGQILDDAFGDFELSPEQEAAQRDAELQFNHCMAEQGFPLEETESGDGVVAFELDDDVDPEAIDEAFGHCEDALNEAFEQIFGDLGEGE